MNDFVKLRPVVDITELPTEVKSMAYDVYQDDINGNNSYLHIYVSHEPYDEWSSKTERDLNQWFVDNDFPDEFILLYWW